MNAPCLPITERARTFSRQIRRNGSVKQNGQRVMGTTEREDDIVPRYSRFDRKRRHGSAFTPGIEPVTEEGTPGSPEASDASAAVSSNPKTLRWRVGFFLILVCFCGFGLAGG